MRSFCVGARRSHLLSPSLHCCVVAVPTRAIRSQHVRADDAAADLVAAVEDYSVRPSHSRPLCPEIPMIALSLVLQAPLESASSPTGNVNAAKNVQTRALQ